MQNHRLECKRRHFCLTLFDFILPADALFWESVQEWCDLHSFLLRRQLQVQMCCRLQRQEVRKRYSSNKTPSFLFYSDRSTLVLLEVKGKHVQTKNGYWNDHRSSPNLNYSSLQILAKVTIHIDAKPKFSIKKKEEIYDVPSRRSAAKATAREPIKFNLTGLNGFYHNRKYPSIAGPTRRYGTYEVPDEE